MIRNPKEPVRLVAPGQDDKPEAVRTVYLIKPPSIVEGIAFERAVHEAGGRQPQPAAMMAALRRAIADAYAGAEGEDADARDRTLAKIDQALDAWRAIVEEVQAGATRADPETLAALIRLETELEPVAEIVADSNPALARLRADAKVYPAIRGVEAARMFLVGWENLLGPDGRPVKFRRRPDGVPEELLRLVPALHLAAILAEVERLNRPTVAQAKNSASPSHGSSEQANSAAAS